MLHIVASKYERKNVNFNGVCNPMIFQIQYHLHSVNFINPNRKIITLT